MTTRSWHYVIEDYGSIYPDPATLGLAYDSFYLGEDISLERSAEFYVSNSSFTHSFTGPTGQAGIGDRASVVYTIQSTSGEYNAEATVQWFTRTNGSTNGLYNQVRFRSTIIVDSEAPPPPIFNLPPGDIEHFIEDSEVVAMYLNEAVPRYIIGSDCSELILDWQDVEDNGVEDNGVGFKCFVIERYIGYEYKYYDSTTDSEYSLFNGLPAGRYRIASVDKLNNTSAYSYFRIDTDESAPTVYEDSIHVSVLLPANGQTFDYQLNFDISDSGCELVKDAFSISGKAMPSLGGGPYHSVPSRTAFSLSPFTGTSALAESLGVYNRSMVFSDAVGNDTSPISFSVAYLPDEWAWYIPGGSDSIPAAHFSEGTQYGRVNFSGNIRYQNSDHNTAWDLEKVFNELCLQFGDQYRYPSISSLNSNVTNGEQLNLSNISIDELVRLHRTVTSLNNLSGLSIHVRVRIPISTEYISPLLNKSDLDNEVPPEPFHEVISYLEIQGFNIEPSLERPWNIQGEYFDWYVTPGMIGAAVPSSNASQLSRSSLYLNSSNLLGLQQELEGGFSFIDSDQDTVELKFTWNEEAKTFTPYLVEWDYFDLTNELASYALPYEFIYDSLPPEFQEGNVQIFNQEDEPFQALTLEEGVTVFGSTGAPGQIQFQGVGDFTGIAHVTLHYNGETSESIPCNPEETLPHIWDFSVPWPTAFNDGGLEAGVRAPLTIEVEDLAGNTTAIEMDLIVDNQIPSAPNLGNPLIHVESPDFSYHAGPYFGYGEEDIRKVELLLQDHFLGVDPLEAWTFSVYDLAGSNRTLNVLGIDDDFLSGLPMAERIQVDQHLNDEDWKALFAWASQGSDPFSPMLVYTELEDRLILLFDRQFPANEELLLDLGISDLMGNELLRSWTFYSPADVSEQDFTISGTGDDQGNLGYEEWTGSHYLALEPASSQLSWNAVMLAYRHEDDAAGDWTQAVDHLGSAPDSQLWLSKLEPHGLYSFKALPINGSGAVNYQASLEFSESHRVANYLPRMEWLTPFEEGRVFLEDSQLHAGPYSRLSYRWKDWDNQENHRLDTINAHLYQGSDLVMNSSDEVLVVYEDPANPDQGLLAFSHGEYSLSNGEVHRIQMRPYDLWELSPDPPDTSILAGGEITFLYDSHPPQWQNLEAEQWEENLEFPWSMSALNLNVSDAGIGTESIYVYQEDPQGNIETIGEFHLNPGGESLDEKPLQVMLHEGQYSLSYRLVDRLGNEIEEAIPRGAYYDGTPPTLLDIELDVPQSLQRQSSDRVTLGTTLAGFSLGWSDSEQDYSSLPMEQRPYSGLARVEWRYFNQQSQKVMKGSMNVHVPYEEHLQLNCIPQGEILVEGEAYTLELRLVDRGGNPSAWVPFEKELVFELPSPKMSIANWNLPMVDELRISNLVQADLPEMLVEDVFNEEAIFYRYNLLNQEKEPLAEDISSILFDAQGSYYLEVIASDGHSVYLREVYPLVFDDLPPENLSLQVLPEEPTAYYGGEALALGLMANDLHSGVAHYELLVHRGDALLWQLELTPAQAKHIDLTIPENSLEEIRLSATAHDRGGNSNPSPVELLRFTPEDRTQGLAIETSYYHGYGQGIAAQWEFKGPQEVSGYNVELLALGDNPEQSISLGNQSESSCYIPWASLSQLEEHEYLQWRITPMAISGQPLASSLSIPIVVDHMAPEIQRLEHSEVTRLDKLNVEWTLEENQELAAMEIQLEGLKLLDNGEYQWTSLERMAWDNPMLEGSVNLISLIDQALLEELRRIPEDMVDPSMAFEALQFRLQVKDLAGNLSEALSAPIPIDRSPAPSFLVNDQGDYINPLENDLIFHWTWAASDPESGETHYLYQLTGNGRILGDSWLKTHERFARFTGEEIAASFDNGTQLVLLVKRVSPSGEEALQWSNGIVLDRDAPEISPVLLFDSDLEEMDLHYSESQEIYLRASAQDPDSGISEFRYVPGELTSQGFRPLENSSETIHGVGEYSALVDIRTILPLLEEANQRVCYSVQAYNGVELASLPSLSPEIIYVPEDQSPELWDFALSYQDGSLHASWAVRSPIPLKLQELQILDSMGSPLGSSHGDGFQILNGGARFASFGNLHLPEGSYSLQIILEDLAGQRFPFPSHSIYIDETAPEVVHAEISPFVYQSLEADLRFTEGIGEIQWSLGGNGGSIHSGTQSLPSAPHGWSEGIDLRAGPGWPWLEQREYAPLVFSVRIRDRAGNWSMPQEFPLIYDGTPPEITQFSRDNRIHWNGEWITPQPGQLGQSGTMDGIRLEAQEDHSPITEIHWAEVSQSGDIPGAADWIRMELEGIDKALVLTNQILHGLTVEDGGPFHLALRVLNQAGQYSEISYSELLVADFEAPEFTLNWINALAMEGPEQDQAVVDQLGQLEVEITNEQSSWVNVSLQLLNRNGVETYRIAQNWDRTPSGDSMILEFPVDDSIEGLQTVVVTLMDLHGRENSETSYFRCNPAPVLDLPSILETYPGQPLDIQYREWILDSHGIDRIVLSGSSLSEPLDIPWGDPLVITLEHGSPLAQVTDYDFQIKAVDNLGTESTMDQLIRVVNSREGTLDVDEYWSGTHYLTGPLTVPENITLTLAPNTRVLARVGTIQEENPEILLALDSQLIHEGTAYYGTTSEDPDLRWQGIRSYIDLDLRGITISKAERGLVMTEGLNLELSECSFLDNRIGLHLLNQRTDILDCLFQGNLFYGVKEELGAVVHLENSQFQDNGNDYYQGTESVLTPDELQAKNSESQGEIQ